MNVARAPLQIGGVPYGQSGMGEVVAMAGGVERTLQEIMYQQVGFAPILRKGLSDAGTPI